MSENGMFEKTKSFSIKRYWFDDIKLKSSFYRIGESLNIDFNVNSTCFLSQSLVKIEMKFKSNCETCADAFCEVTCFCEFVFPNLKCKEDIPEFFYSNSIAIMFPYLRAFVSLVTMQANFGEPIVLPLLNLSAIGQTVKNDMKVVE